MVSAPSSKLRTLLAAPLLSLSLFFKLHLLLLLKFLLLLLILLLLNR